MDDTPIEDTGLDGTVRFLKILVTTLTVTTILGLIVLITVIVMRVQDMEPQTALPALPDQITLPEGATATAVTHGTGWFAVVTSDNRILMYDAATGALFQTVTVDAP